jgi:hypothetical protein
LGLFFERVSLVERVLWQAGVCAHGRRPRPVSKVVEELSRAIDRSELEVAREAVSLAVHAADPTRRAAGAARAVHVGYYLADVGRAQLEAQLGYHPGRRQRVRRAIFHHPTEAYLGGIALVSLVSVLGGIGYALGAGASTWQALAAGVLLVPGVTAAVSLVNWIVSLTVAPRILPWTFTGHPRRVPRHGGHPGDADA